MIPIADMHCDTISALYNSNDHNQNLRKNKLHVDLERLKRANYNLQTFALYQDIKNQEHPYKYAMDLLNLYQDEIEANSDLVTPVLFKEDLEELSASGKIGSLLTLEEGEACEGDLSKLRKFFDKGVRLITLTWNNPNSLGYPNKFNFETMTFEPDNENGLTDKGIEFLQEMEKLGIVPDVSHLSDKGFYDVYNHATKPFVASHSNARALCSFPRNLTDDMIKKIADKGGVIGLNFCGSFIDLKTQFASIDGIVEHAKYIANIGGVDSVGFGSDFDGIPDTLELKECSQMPKLIAALSKAGFSDNDIEKIAYENVFRVLKTTLPSKA